MSVKLFLWPLALWLLATRRYAALAYAVALAADNTLAHSEAAAFTSRAAASDYIERTVASDPARAGTLHVLPSFEVAV